MAERTTSAVTLVFKHSSWPSLPSGNTKFIELKNPESFEAGLFKRLLNRTDLVKSGFSLKIGEVHNVLCDTERKFVLADPLFIDSIKANTVRSDLALTALFAHELSHYILDLYRMQAEQEVFGSPPFKILDQWIPASDIEHAQVEPIAAELMLRAGFSREEVRKAFSDFHHWMVMLEQAFKDAGADPSTDMSTRLLVIKAYGSEKFDK